MYIRHNKIQQLCNFANEANKKRSKDNGSDVKVKQCKQTVNEIIFHLEYPKYPGSDANVLPHMVED
jgi:DNA recombination-dependent growth factor C